MSVRMDLGVVTVGKLTPEEKDKGLLLGLFLRCRKPGHMAKDCNQFSNYLLEHPRMTQKPSSGDET
jgi:hypothetical protein